MGKLLQRLMDPARSGVYRVHESVAIEDALAGATVDLARISLAGADSKEALLGRLAAVLGFPEWFGGNWDALEDCLGDLSWRPASAHVLLFEAARPGDAVGVLCDILDSTAEYWRSQGTPFFAVFVDPERRFALPELYRAG